MNLTKSLLAAGGAEDAERGGEDVDGANIKNEMR